MLKENVLRGRYKKYGELSNDLHNIWRQARQESKANEAVVEAIEAIVDKMIQTQREIIAGRKKQQVKSIPLCYAVDHLNKAIKKDFKRDFFSKD